jgi:hypothetical protein
MFGYYKYTTGLSFAEERIGPLAAIVTTIFYLLALYLLILPITPENLFASIYSESLIKTTHQHLLLLVGFDTLIYRKYYDTPPILVGHHSTAQLKGYKTQGGSTAAPSGSTARLTQINSSKHQRQYFWSSTGNKYRLTILITESGTPLTCTRQVEGSGSTILGRQAEVERYYCFARVVLLG